jgi:hypothetical protein
MPVEIIESCLPVPVLVLSNPPFDTRHVDEPESLESAMNGKKKSDRMGGQEQSGFRPRGEETRERVGAREEKRRRSPCFVLNLLLVARVIERERKTERGREREREREDKVCVRQQHSIQTMMNAG